MNAVAEAIGALNRLLQRVPASVTQLALRVGVSLPFWNSGVLKWEHFPTEINETAVLLFSDEFKLHVFGAEIPFPFPAVTAHLVALAEVILPALLVGGLLSRVAAVGLLVMTIVIQLTIPSGWAVHLTWAAMALAIVCYGGGKLSLDRMLGIER